MMSLGLYTEIRIATKLGCPSCTKRHGGESATGKMTGKSLSRADQELIYHVSTTYVT